MDIDIEVIRRYLTGNQEEGDEAKIIYWFSDLRYEKEISQKFRAIWDELDEQKFARESDGSIMLGRIYRKIKKNEFNEMPGKKISIRFIESFKKVAAILIIPLIIYVIVAGTMGIHLNNKVKYSELYSPVGTRTKFFLQDGSTGWLNGGSTLKFPVEFIGKSRKVHLKGEAFFDVVKDTRRSFIVVGNHTQVLVHGTSFNVQAYPEDADTRITVVEGKVSVMKRVVDKYIPIASLEPDQMCIYYHEKGSFSVSAVNSREIAAWKNGKLVFKNETLSTIVKKLNRWYNVNIVIKDEILNSEPYQLTLVDETLEEVLKLLHRSGPINYKDLGRVKRKDGSFEKRKIELKYRVSKSHS